MRIKSVWAILLLTVSMSNAQPLRVMTYNIRYDNPADGVNAWPNRKEWLARQVKTVDPDVLGVQESLPHQVTWLSLALQGYAKVGVGRDENGSGESVTIFIRNDRFAILDSGTFWLSETPATMSKGWDAAIRRICTYTLIKEKKSEQRYLVMNTHFDHVGAYARRKSAELLNAKVSELNKEDHPVILIGDFNATPDSSPVEILKYYLKEARLIARNVHRPQQGSYNAFDTSKPAEDLIDHIFVSRKCDVKTYSMLVETHDKRYPSDHFPVVVELVKR